MQLLLWDILKPMVDGLLGRGKPKPPLFPSVAGKRARVKPARPQPQREPSEALTVETKPRRRARGEVAAAIGPARGAASIAAAKSAGSVAATMTAQERYDAVVKAMLSQYGIKVRKWRKNMSGVAYELRYRDGSVKRLLESPYPKGPMSAAIFLHEIGHHAIGFNRYKPRCLEEYHAWKWSLEAMEAQGLDVTDAVRYRMHLSLWYAVGKASRRGIKNLPPELLPFVEKPIKVGGRGERQT